MNVTSINNQVPQVPQYAQPPQYTQAVSAAPNYTVIDEECVRGMLSLQPLVRGQNEPDLVFWDHVVEYTLTYWPGIHPKAYLRTFRRIYGQCDHPPDKRDGVAGWWAPFRAARQKFKLKPIREHRAPDVVAREKAERADRHAKKLERRVASFVRPPPAAPAPAVLPARASLMSRGEAAFRAELASRFLEIDQIITHHKHLSPTVTYSATPDGISRAFLSFGQGAFTSLFGK